MPERYFNLLERHQKLDAALRAAQRRLWPDPFEIARLNRIKRALKARLAMLTRRRPAHG